MDIVLLPTLLDSATPAEAIGLMKTSRRSAVLTQVPDELRLITLHEACQGSIAGVGSLREIHAGIHVPLLSPSLLEDVGGTTLRRMDAAAIDGGNRLAQVMAAHLRELSPLGEEHRQFVGDHAVDVEVTSLLRGAGSKLGLLGLRVGGAILVTSHERVARGFVTVPKTYVCANPSPHYYDSNPGAWCLTGDGYKVTVY